MDSVTEEEVTRQTQSEIERVDPDQPLWHSQSLSSKLNNAIKVRFIVSPTKFSLNVCRYVEDYTVQVKSFTQ